jgi:vitamin B12 transporter
LLAGVDSRSTNTSQEYYSLSMFGEYSTKLGDTASMWQLSPYSSLVYHHNDLNIEIGARWNHHNIYGNNFTYTFNPSYFINKKIKVFANLSSAFKTPTLYQLFDPYTGNRFLEPEKTMIIEGGAELYFDNVFLRLTNFYRKTDNAIQYIITDPNFFLGHYLNINNQENYGTELEWKYRNGKVDISGNYTFTKGRISSVYTENGDFLGKDTSYNNLYRVPEHVINLFAGYSINPKFSLNTVFKYSGSRLEPVYASAPYRLDDFYTIDLSFHYRFSRQIRAYLDLRNITNQEYFDILGYNSRKFNFAAGLDVQF